MHAGDRWKRPRAGCDCAPERKREIWSTIGPERIDNENEDVVGTSCSKVGASNDRRRCPRSARFA
ncbi:hypothetical protein ACFQJ8_02205 [Halocatena marina]|uniref:hypothetical protein n=1 Tax=Halocatena marina TaxID=2934937 RepID=UPI00361EA93B